MNMVTLGSNEYKRPFTLIELFICFALLAVLGGVFLIRGAAMLEHYRFESDTSTLLDEINVSKHLALTASCDIHLHLSKNKGGLLCFKQTDEPLHFPGVFDKHKHLKAISSLKVNEMEKEHVIITFSGTGFVSPEGCLSLLSKNGKAYKILLSLTSELFFKDRLDIQKRSN